MAHPRQRRHARRSACTELHTAARHRVRSRRGCSRSCPAPGGLGCGVSGTSSARSVGRGGAGARVQVQTVGMVIAGARAPRRKRVCIGDAAPMQTSIAGRASAGRSVGGVPAEAKKGRLTGWGVCRARGAAGGQSLPVHASAVFSAPVSEPDHAVGSLWIVQGNLECRCKLRRARWKVCQTTLTLKCVQGWGSETIGHLWTTCSFGIVDRCVCGLASGRMPFGA